MGEGSFWGVLLSLASVVFPLLLAWFLILRQASRRRRPPHR